MFKFNFPDPSTKKSCEDNGSDETEVKTDRKRVDNEKPGAKSNTEEIPAEEITLCADMKKFEGITKRVFVCKDQTTLQYLDCQELEEQLCAENCQQSAISQAVSTESDLLPGVYEGGLKIWECSLDLANHLGSLQIAFRGLKVLELGCGAGLPGLYALKQEAHVTFQDYNKEVITDYTMPNCLLNAPRAVVEGSCHFYSGDWGSLCTLLGDREIKFDMILTSETIYQPSNYNKLHRLFDKLITKTGTIYVAAKVHYFGVGGGVADFVNFVKKQKVFSVESTITHKAGVQRKILCLQRLF